MRVRHNDGALLPGLYARVEVGGVAPHAAVLVDDAAVGTDQDKKYVLVVNDRNRVQYREVLLGVRHDKLCVTTKGLNPNELIVVNGTQRVKPGDTVKANVVTMNGAATTPNAAS